MTLRERQWFLVPLGIWLVASVLTALSGPFGTHDAMHFGTRVAYWGGVCAASVGFSMIAVRLQNDRSQGVKLLVWLGFALFLSASIHVANGILFGFGEALGSYIYLFAIVLVVVVLVFMTIWLVQPDVPSQPDANRMAKFLERLPLEKRGALIRLEAQDHYLKVVTRAGDCLILMRIGDAAKELEEGYGVQVHRSHWVARGAITAHNRRAGRDFLMTEDGAEIPVSRNNRSQIANLTHAIGELR